MATNIVYAEYVKWLTQYMGKHCFIVMWSDGTWNKFSFEWHNEETFFKQKDFGLINILTNKASNKKISKEDAIKYITKRIKEIESE